MRFEQHESVGYDWAKLVGREVADKLGPGDIERLSDVAAELARLSADADAVRRDAVAAEMAHISDEGGAMREDIEAEMAHFCADDAALRDEMVADMARTRASQAESRRILAELRAQHEADPDAFEARWQRLLVSEDGQRMVNAWRISEALSAIALDDQRTELERDEASRGLADAAAAAKDQPGDGPDLRQTHLRSASARMRRLCVKGLSDARPSRHLPQVATRPRERRERRHVARSTSSSDPGGDDGGESEPASQGDSAGEVLHQIALSREQLAELADLIAVRLAERQAGELIDAAELARRIGRSREFVYANQAALGALRLGTGDRPRLAFRWPDALDGLRAAERPRRAMTQGRATRPRKQDKTAGVELLPIRGGSR